MYIVMKASNLTSCKIPTNIFLLSNLQFMQRSVNSIVLTAQLTDT